MLDSDSLHNIEYILNLCKSLVKTSPDLGIGSNYLDSANYKVPLLTKFGVLIIRICLKNLYSQIIKVRPLNQIVFVS